MPAVKPIPDDYPLLSPYVCVDGVADAIAFYTEVFGAVERFRVPMPDGSVGHAEVAFGDSLIMLSDPYPEMDVNPPPHYQGSPVKLSLYVEDVDAVVAKAVEKGAEITKPVEDQFYGDRAGMIRDPWGHQWNIATHIEDVTPEEVARRAQEFEG